MKSSLSDTEGHGNFEELYENWVYKHYKYIVKITVMLQICCSYGYAAILQLQVCCNAAGKGMLKMSLFFIQYVLFDDFIIIREHLNPFSPRISWPHAEDGLQIISLLKLIDCTSILFYIPFLNYFTRGVTIAHERLRNLGLWSALFGHWGGRDHREFFIVSLTLLIKWHRTR